MGKFFLKFFSFFIIVAILLLIYLSYFGIKTNKFDNLIKKKANEVSEYIKLEFKETNIHINLKEFNIIVRLQNPKILIKNDEIILSKLDLFLPLKSFFSSDFILKRSEVAFIKNDIKDLTKVTNIFLPKIINKQLNKIFSKGKIEGEFIIPFNPDGSIAKDYGFSGKLSDAQINLTKEFSIKNLTTEIIHKKNKENNNFEIIIKKGSVYNIKLANSYINIIREKNKTNITSLISTTGNLSFNQVKKISSILKVSTKNIKDINGQIDLKTNINFSLDNKFKIKDIFYYTEGNIDDFTIHIDEKKIIKRYLPEYDSKIILKNTKINLESSKLNRTTKLEGLIKIKNNFDSFKINEVLNHSKKNHNINGLIDLTSSKVKISRLNYYKESGQKSEVSFDINFILDKIYTIKKLNFIANNNKINLSNIKLNKNFEILDFNKLEIKTFLDNSINNDFLINKSKKIDIIGKVFDAQPMLKSLFKKSDKRIFSKDFNSELKINFDKALTGTNDDVSNFAMIASINNGSFNKLILKGNFTKDEIIEMSIYEMDKDKKTLQVISDRARPFIKNFDFIEGFEGGKLEYESVISKNISNTNLIITDFKVSKVPALAQLLTLASLQGIADTLSGEGIRFESFEMKSNSKGNVMNIEEALALGPAISILLEGYVDKGKVISLRGTLVPATQLNAIIASIPIVGDILVGKKTGEGVVGVSFKMKGPPKDIKTTVNPIKTLTPRFIVRAVERLKKRKQEEAK